MYLVGTTRKFIQNMRKTANITYYIREIDGQLLSQIWYENLSFDIILISNI